MGHLDAEGPVVVRGGGGCGGGGSGNRGARQACMSARSGHMRHRWGWTLVEDSELRRAI